MAHVRKQNDASLELMPVMNLVTILIPLLLVTAQVVNLSVIDSTVPGIIKQTEEPVDPGLQLTVAITDQGLALKGDGEVLPDAGSLELPCSAAPCQGVQSYDYRGLTDLLGRVKDAHPDEQTLILLPEERVSYEVLVKVMDAAREDLDQRTAEGESRPLFPQVVMAGGAT